MARLKRGTNSPEVWSALGRRGGGGVGLEGGPTRASADRDEGAASRIAKTRGADGTACNSTYTVQTSNVARLCSVTRHLLSMSWMPSVRKGFFSKWSFDDLGLRPFDVQLRPASERPASPCPSFTNDASFFLFLFFGWSSFRCCASEATCMKVQTGTHTYTHRCQQRNACSYPIGVPSGEPLRKRSCERAVERVAFLCGARPGPTMRGDVGRQARRWIGLELKLELELQQVATRARRIPDLQ